LGILDGTSILRDYRDDFCLMYGNDTDKLNGNLQDYFLADIEKRERELPSSE
jgi:hypothetical protein